MENGITKRQSAILQGAAIWMMVYHHLYSFAVEYGSLLPFMQVDTVQRIGWFCKLCVGIFAFVSGYGMYYVLDRQPREGFWDRLLREYRCVLGRILKLYGKLWLVLLIYMGILFGILGLPFDPAQLLGNLTALNPTYNGAWWYVEQYAKMLLALPLLDLLLTRFTRPGEEKCKWIFYLTLGLLGGGALLAGRLWLPGLWTLAVAVKDGLRISFLLVFVAGYLIARYGLWQRVDKVLRRRGGWLPVCLSVALLGAVIALRTMLATDAAYAKLDFLFAPLFSYGVLTLLSRVPPLGAFLAWWGKQSTYIWLVHGFLYGWLYYLIRPHVRLDIWVYLAVLLASAVVSLLLQALTGIPGRLVRRQSRKGDKNPGKREGIPE